MALEPNNPSNNPKIPLHLTKMTKDSNNMCLHKNIRDFQALTIVG